MQTFTYDKLPENYDTHELAERADVAATYLGNKIRHIVANGIPPCYHCCSTFPPTITLQPNHTWCIYGAVTIDDIDFRFNYTATVDDSGNESIKIVLGNDTQPREIPLTSARIQGAILDAIKTLDHD